MSQSFPRGTLWLALALVAGALACGPRREARLEEIRARQQSGEFGPTLEPLTELLGETPDDPELNHLYGLALLGTRQPELAIWPLRKAARDPQRAIEDGLLLGTALLRGGSPADAVREIVHVLELAPDRVDALRLLVEARLEARQHEEVLQDAARLLELEPGNPDALMARLLAFLSLDRPDEAEPVLVELREAVAVADQTGEGPWSARLCAASATFAKEKGDREAAEELWNACLERFPGQEVVVFGAIDFVERSEPARAVEILRRAHEADRTHLPFLEALANRLGASGQGAEAEALLLAATTGAGIDVQAWFALADFYEQRDEIAKARDAMAEGLRRMGEAPATQVAAYVDLLIRAGDYDQAEKLIADFEPSPVMFNLLRGRLLLAQGQPAKALEALEAGLRLWPDHSVARWLAGTAAEQLGDYGRAVEEYGEAIRNDRANREAVMSLLRLLEAQGRDDEALTVLARYRSENPDDAEMLVQRIRFAHRAGESRIVRGSARRLRALPGQRGVAAAEIAAIRAAEAGPAAGIEEIRASKLDLTQPENGPALERLVELLVADGKPREAADATAAALGAHPDEALFHELRGRALRGAGEPAAARETLERALELEPDRPTALAELAALAAEQGDRASALALYDRAAGKDPESPAYPWAAIQLVAGGDDGADLERRLEALLARHGTHAAAASLLAERLRARDPERARDLARRAVLFGRGPKAEQTLGRTEPDGRAEEQE